MVTWKSIFLAPLDQDVEVLVTDGIEEYHLRFPCRRTESGWINSRFQTPLPNRLKILGWRVRK
jgi:hypothetical protein